MSSDVLCWRFDRTARHEIEMHESRLARDIFVFWICIIDGQCKTLRVGCEVLLCSAVGNYAGPCRVKYLSSTGYLERACICLTEHPIIIPTLRISYIEPRKSLTYGVQESHMAIYRNGFVRAPYSGILLHTVYPVLRTHIQSTIRSTINIENHDYSYSLVTGS